MLRCPHCKRPFYGSPRVVKPGELYECRCRKCLGFWELNAQGDIITEEGTDTDGDQTKEEIHT